MPILNIQGTIINLADTGTSPDWSQGVIAFAQAVANALQGVAGSFDVSPQILTLDPYNPGVNVNVPLLVFPVNNVRSVIIYYSLYRTTTLANVADAGTIQLLYNPSNATGSKWEIVRVGTEDGGGGTTFTITDAGQIQLTTNTLSGLNHSGKLSYNAKALTFV